MERDVLDRAIAFAVEAHAGMTRKDGSPYILHPLEDMTIVGTMTFDHEVLAAAVLHDVIEDTDVTEEDLRAAFGDRVADLVMSETEDKHLDQPKTETWRLRKKESLEHLKNGSEACKMLWLGDKLANLRNIKRGYEKVGDSVFNKFNVKDPLEHKWYYTTVLEYLGSLKDYSAYREYERLVHDVFDRY